MLFAKVHGMKVLAAVIVAACATAVQARPVVQGGAGYGMDTIAGRGGKIYRVTNLNADGTGSLKACFDGTSPRVCIFEVSGTIRITKDLKIANPYITVAGQTAPSPGITIRGAALQIQTHDVLVQHLRVRAGDDKNGPDPANRDSLKIEGSSSRTAKNIVIDHCTFSWAIDELASVWGPTDNITFSNNIFSEPLNESIHPKDSGSGMEKHGFGVLIGSSPSGGRVTMVGNLFAHIVERNPLSRARELVYVNNLVYNRVNLDLNIATQDDRTTKSAVQGNVFLRGPSYDRTTKPVYIMTSGTWGLTNSSRVFVKDVYAPESGTSLSSLVSQAGGTISSLLQTSTAPVWNSGLTARSTANNGVYNRVLSYAGARPTDRDSVDKRVVQTVKSRNGQVINCVSSNGSSRCNKNGGGWPSLTQRTRKLTLPSDYNSVASNGYTKLENWLDSMHEQVQGTSSSASPTTAAALSVK
jgi:pectate lyase